MKVSFIDAEDGKELFEVDFPFRTWRLMKRAAHAEDVSLDSWIEKVLHDALGRELREP